MVETHPFGSFVPKNCQFLFLGTFTAKVDDPSYDWFFTSKRNQFWIIMTEVYGIKLTNKKEKENLFTELKMAITDIILQCERSENTNADNNLINMVFNVKVINKIITENNIETIFFSSRMAEKLFKNNFKEIKIKFPQINFVTLPSSSPRYAAMTKLEKIRYYKELLPKLNSLNRF
ncbi:MAG: hypothetical protein WC841_03705 [Candidatus Shapirobacteria bacterium]|jgi:TDG/mug DNA glycosylase family protein